MRRILFYICLFAGLHAIAQENAQLTKTFSAEDSLALVTIAALPDSVRPAAIEACHKPQILVKAEALQQGTSEAFRKLTADYTKEEQKKLWDLARYPALVNEIAGDGKKSKEELAAIAARYPKEIQPAVKAFGRKHYEVISEMSKLYQNSEAEFRKILAPYPESTRNAYTKLSRRPDVLHTLANNMHLAVILGEMHRTDAARTALMLDSIRMQHKQQTAKELEAWKSGLEANPRARQEMEQAAREFASETGTGSEDIDDVYKTPGEQSAGQPAPGKREAEGAEPVVGNNYYMQPYPYWFGYPAWYDYPFWYPYPYWYHTGFYWGPGGMVFIGYPSPLFMQWYLYQPYHHYYYANFTDYCLSYNRQYYGPRAARTGFNHQVTQWRRANEAHLPKGYFNADAQRPQRIRELGKFEMEYNNATKGVLRKNVTRPEYLERNQKNYPNIRPALRQPHMNKPVEYERRQERHKMDRPGGVTPRPGKPPGGFTNPSPKKSGGGLRRPR